jgi:hypothetical protein
VESFNSMKCRDTTEPLRSLVSTIHRRRRMAVTQSQRTRWRIAAAARARS